MHILLVEDNEDLRTTLAEMLEEVGHRVTQAAGGREAVSRLDVEVPDLIVLDYMMPEMSGAEFREWQRARPDLRDIPVLLLTAASSIRDLPTIAPDAVLHKPFELPELLRCLDTLAARKGGGLTAASRGRPGS